MWLSIHAAFTVEEGEGGGRWRRRRKRRRDCSHRGREVVFLFSLAHREGKTIGVQMDAFPYSWMTPLPPSPPSSPPFLLPFPFPHFRFTKRSTVGALLLDDHLCEI